MVSTYIMYMIKCCDDNIEGCYIGSTKDFKGRKHQHKTSCNNVQKYNIHIYKFIRENGGWTNFEMKPIEEFICDTKVQAAIREQHWINFYKSDLNSRNSYTSDEDRKDKITEYYETNKDKLKDNMKEYYKTNKDNILEHVKEYYESNKDKIKQHQQVKNDCICGNTYTNSHKKRHLKTQKHQDYLLNSSNTDNLNK